MENGMTNEDSTTKVVVIHQLVKLFRLLKKQDYS